MYSKLKNLSFSTIVFIALSCSFEKNFRFGNPIPYHLLINLTLKEYTTQYSRM